VVVSQGTGFGSAAFVFKPDPAQNLGTTSITITITQVCPSVCIGVSTESWSFKVEVVASPDEVPAFAYDLETSTEENTASIEDAYLPVVEAGETTISVQIANITRVALITVIYN
jgi:hypothetical protein